MSIDSDYSQGAPPPPNDPLVLSAEHVRAWYALLPPDLKEAISDDADTSADTLAAAVAREMNLGEIRTWSDIVVRHADEIVHLGQARRVRLLCWVAQSSWPQPSAVNAIAGRIEDDEEGKGGGRSKVAPLFRADIEALAGVVTMRQARALMGVDTVKAVDAGTKDFEQAYHSGAM